MSMPQASVHLTQRDGLTTASLPRRAICPLCNTEGAKRLFLAKDRVHHLPGVFGIYRCAGCRAIFVQPRMNAEQLSIYCPDNDESHRASQSAGNKTDAGWQRFVLEHHYGYPKPEGEGSGAPRRAAAFLLSWFIGNGVIPYRGAGKILDLGAGDGLCLQRLKQWGWNPYGVESHATSARRAQSLGFTVHHGTLAEAHFPNSFFDVVRLNNALEHFSDPLAEFEEINRVLKHDGLVYVTVPNTRSLAFWLFGENWYTLDAPRHAISYCPCALRTLCDAAGFEIAEIRFNAGPVNFLRSLTYYFEDKGAGWPAWVRRIGWGRNKLITGVLAPFFFIVDASGYGDFLHATLRKRPCLVITGAKIFDKTRRAGRVTGATVRMIRRHEGRSKQSSTPRSGLG